MCPRIRLGGEHPDGRPLHVRARGAGVGHIRLYMCHVRLCMCQIRLYMCHIRLYMCHIRLYIFHIRLFMHHVCRLGGEHRRNILTAGRHHPSSNSYERTGNKIDLNQIYPRIRLGGEHRRNILTAGLFMCEHAGQAWNPAP